MSVYGAVIFGAGCLALVVIGTVAREAYRCLATMEEDGIDGEIIDREGRRSDARGGEKGRGG